MRLDELDALAAELDRLSGSGDSICSAAEMAAASFETLYNQM